MLKRRWLHKKQNPLSWTLASLTWLYIYWTHTFSKSSCSLDRKLCHVVAHNIIKNNFCKTLENAFFYWFNTAIENRNDTRTKLIILFLSEWKQNLFSWIATTNTSTTIGLKYWYNWTLTFSSIVYQRHSLKWNQNEI